MGARPGEAVAKRSAQHAGPADDDRNLRIETEQFLEKFCGRVHHSLPWHFRNGERKPVHAEDRTIRG